MKNMLIIGALSVAMLQTVFAQQEEKPEASRDIAIRLSDEDPVEPGDIVVRLPDVNPPPLSAEKWERAEKRRRVIVALPYGYSPIERCTLGQMVKECDRIMIGRISRIEAQRGTGWFGMKRDPGKLTLTIGVETNLFGSGKRSVSLELNESEYPDWSNRQEERALVFFADVSMERPPENTRHFDFDKRKMKMASHGKISILHGSWGAINVDDAETEKFYLSAVDGYLKNLRGHDRDREAYYEFLLTLSQSPVERIQDDAITDLRWLLLYTPSPELKRRLEDKRLDERLKDYVRVIVLPNRGEEVP